MVGTLRPVPDTPPRAVLYLRQSISHDDSVSLELQETAGREYCRRMGYTVVAVLSDPGITGRTWKRPAVQRVMQMVDDSEADVVVLWKWSRLSRSRRDWAVAADRAEVAGGRIESSTETVDVTTATGRLARGVLVEFAAFESDRIGEVWKEVHSSRLAQGLAPNGKPRFGYVWNPATKIHEPDPEAGPVLAEAYRRYVAGTSVYTLVRWLNSEQITTTSGNAWSDHALRRVLDSGFAAGHIRWRGDLHPGVHTPLIDADTWQAFLDARVERRRVPAPVKRSRYVLSGLVRCGRCQGPMVANPRGEGRTASFRCSTSKERGPEACAGGYIGMNVVLEEVMGWLRDEAAADVDETASAKRAAERKRVSSTGDVRRYATRLAKIEGAMEKLRRLSAEDDITDEEFRSTRASYIEERDALLEKQAEAARSVRMVVADRAAVATGLLDGWATKPVEVKRAVMGSLIDRVVVLTGDRSGVKGQRNGASNATVKVIPK